MTNDEAWRTRARLIWAVIFLYVVGFASVAVVLHIRLLDAEEALARCRDAYPESEHRCFSAMHEHWPECPGGDFVEHLDIHGVHGCANVMYLGCEGGEPSVIGYLDPRGMRASWGCEPGCPFPDMFQLPSVTTGPMAGRRRCALWDREVRR